MQHQKSKRTMFYATNAHKTDSAVLLIFRKGFIDALMLNMHRTKCIKTLSKEEPNAQALCSRHARDAISF